MSDRRKNTPRQKKTASRSSGTGKITEAPHQTTPETPKSAPETASQRKGASEKPRFYSTGIIPGQFSGGRPERFHRPRPTQMPPNPPAHFPLDLWPEANVILLEARKKFPNQSCMLDLCKYIISGLSPLYYGAVKAGKIEAAAVLREGLGGMLDMLRSLLVCNSDDPYAELGWARNESAEVYQSARNSEEWMRFAKAIANLRGDGCPSGARATSKNRTRGGCDFARRSYHPRSAIQNRGHDQKSA